MLLLPFLVGVLETGLSWVHVPLLIAWLAGYLFSYFALLAVKTGRTARVRRQLVTYGSVAATAAVVCLVAVPALVVFAPAFAALVAVNAVYARRRDDRSIVNDLASVAQACLMVPVAAVAGGAPASTGWTAAAVLALYLAGTAVYVKTMIRERGRAGWRLASALVHAAAAVVAWLVAPALGVAFAWFLARAVVLPRFPLTPRTVGLIEVGNSVLLLLLVPPST
jgi:hypothetical protein